MKLNAALVQRTLSTFEAQAIPENHPIVPQLNQVFGDHTFFINTAGLHVVEPVEAAEPAPESGKVIRVAAWTDGNRSSLAPHPPQATDVVVPLKASEDGSAA